MPPVLPMRELGGGRELVRERDHRRMELVAGRVALAFEVDERPDPGKPDRDVDRALAPGPAEGVAHDHAEFDAGQLP